MPLAALIPVLYVAAVTPALVRVDLREHRLPNRMVVPGIAVGLVAAVLQWSPVPLLAALGYGGLLALLGVRGGVGMGDVKLGVLLGLASPTAGVALGSPLTAFLLGGAIASVALVRRGPRARIPFGPPMLAGYWVALVVAMVSGSSAGTP